MPSVKYGRAFPNLAVPFVIRMTASSTGGNAFPHPAEGFITRAEGAPPSLDGVLTGEDEV